jgi:hypothetical protein
VQLRSELSCATCSGCGFTGFFDGLQDFVRTRDRKLVCENHKKILVDCGFAMQSMRAALFKQTTSMRKKA